MIIKIKTQQEKDSFQVLMINVSEAIAIGQKILQSGHIFLFCHKGYRA
jgi:hypothetical protein